jgi:tetratricopeptide (TPR) repeat protein
MRRNVQITAVLLVAAIAAVGCSKRGETKQTKAQESRDSARATPSESSAVDLKDEEGFADAKITGPVSFADGDAAYQAKNYSEATKLFERYTEQRPKNAWGHFMLGLSAWKSHDLAKAESAFEKALSIDKDHFKSLVNLSRVLLDQKRYDDAVVELAHADELNPNSVDVQRLLGRAYSGQGKTDEAVEAYRRAIALDEHDAWSMNNLGSLLLDQKHADEALPLLAKAVMLRNDVPVFHNNLGMALEHTGRFKAAATAYSGAVTADPGYLKARQNLARVEAVKGDREESFDLEAAANGSVEHPKISSDETTIAGR